MVETGDKARRKKPSRGKDDHSRLYVYTDPAVGRFKAIPDEEVREEFRGQVTAFRNLYAFLSQIIPFGDRMEQNDEITTRFLNDVNLQQAVTSHLRERVYEQIRTEAEGGTSA